MLNLYNTLTRKIETFKPMQGIQVKMYTCGPSTYQRPHIGNYRTFLFEDILQRYLEYMGYNVKRLITLTDVEDKAIAQAKKENLTLEQLTSKNEAVFFQDFELLKIKKPAYSIRASSAVDQAAYLIAKLTEKGVAYWYTYKDAENCYFDPLKFHGFGKLAHLDMSKWPEKKRRFHKDTYPGTPWNMGDFILWHGCKTDDVCYQTPIGSGRPAWNIQDVAIVTKTLGFTVDIGCGGIDNLVRHHDYAIAVAEAVSGEEFSRFWLHGAHLFVDGKKMSKSVGNVYYTNGIIAKGYNSAQLRFFLIYSPYREKLNFTFEKLAAASEKLGSVKQLIRELENVQGSGRDDQISGLVDKIVPEFENAMNNNLDVKTAFDSIQETISELYSKREKMSATQAKKLFANLGKIDSVLQCLL